MSEEKLTTEVTEDYKLSNVKIENSVKVYELLSSERQRFRLNIADLNLAEMPSVLDSDNGEALSKDHITIKGIASSTSVDHYGTEMSYKALKEMESQVKKGIVILPRHESLTGSGLAEWDEVIGRTINAEVKEQQVLQPSRPNENNFVLEVESQLYAEDERTKALIKRLSRGEPIGQSIGGWFENVRVEEDSEGEIKRVIVEDVTLDHIAITRAPANPDSGALSLFNIRTSVQSFLNRRKSMSEENKTVEPTVVSEENTNNEASFETEEKQERGVLATIDAEALPVAPISPEDVETTGDAEPAEDLPFAVEYEAMKEEMATMKSELAKMKEEYAKEESDRMKEELAKMKEELEAAKSEVLKMKEQRDLEDEDKQEKIDHEEGAIMDDEDHIEALEVDEEEDTEDLIEDELSRTALPFHNDLPLAAEDVPWEWNTTAEDEVLGKGLDNWDRYKDAHLYMDEKSNPETKSAYKLPIARMINGELRVVLRGVQAAMAALNGARGGVKLPDGDRSQIYETIKKYYKKFGKEAPELVKLSKNEQDSVVVLDNSDELNNSSIDMETESDTRSEDMKPEDMKTLIAEVTRSVISSMKETSNAEALESTPATAETKTTEDRSVIESAYGIKEPSVEELKRRLERAEDTLQRVLAQPLRKGRHTSTSVRGIGAEAELDHLIEATEQEGNQSLASVMKRNKDHLLRSADTVSTKTLTNHQLQDVLAQGLRAAFLDGLLGTPVDGWQ